MSSSARRAGSSIPKLQRGAQKLCRLIEGERVERGPGGKDVVFDRTPSFAKGGGGSEMTRQVSQSAGGSSFGGFEAVSDSQMKLGAA